MELGSSHQTIKVSLPKKFQFVLDDEQSLRSYATDIAKKVDVLREFAPPEIKGTLDLRLQTQLLESKSTEELDFVARSAEGYHYSVIQSSAKLKARINSPEGSSHREDIECKADAFVASSNWGQRNIGRYCDRKVMVEWKPFSQELSFEEMKQRVFSIATFLRDIISSTPEGLIILDCVGAILRGGGSQDVGLMYYLPVHAPYETPRSLHEILCDQDPGSRPPLELRRRLACVLTKAIFQLHIVGWLHKGLKPHNVAFFGNPQLLELPYLIGFDYARRDDVREKTEKPDPAFDLYRHPNAQGDVRQRFRHTFDLFALGLILLEIGLWQRLEDRVAEYRMPKARAERALHKRLEQGGDLVEQLPFHMGSSYCNAVKTCLAIEKEKLKMEMYPDIIRQLESRV